jgi:hypothetical protein
MLDDSMTLEHFTPGEIAEARKLLIHLLRNDDAVGEWSDKTEVRPTGCTIHVKWANRQEVRLDGQEEATRFVRILLTSHDALYLTLIKLFSVGEEDIPALLEEARA